ncbi:zinc ribbon domain-containing protein [Candidatus Pacearchaeota archaeon]|nr:zinc ribbon domain-containing protein [Candidatus Pacearchaeota archaeon]
MPCYEWICKECGHEFETMQKMSAPNPGCPQCQGITDKQLSAGSFHLKGGGWANTGYSKDEKK